MPEVVDLHNGQVSDLEGGLGGPAHLGIVEVESVMYTLFKQPLAVKLFQDDLRTIGSSFHRHLDLVLVALVGLEFHCLFEHALLLRHEFYRQRGLRVLFEVYGGGRDREEACFEGRLALRTAEEGELRLSAAITQGHLLADHVTHPAVPAAHRLRPVYHAPLP